jgi:Flp pilus assembly protein TadG
MTNFVRKLLPNRRGSTAAEFAMLLPLTLIFLLGMVDVGRYMWAVNQAEKATQMGVRFAVVTEPVPTALAGFNFVGTGGLTAGTTVPISAYSKMTCGAATALAVPTCVCAAGGTCPWGTAASATAFTKIYDRVRAMLPEVKRQNVKIEYAPSGLGYAGDPTGSDVFPVVTMKLQGMTFKPITTQVFNISTPMPQVSFSLTMEDGIGAASN